MITIVVELKVIIIQKKVYKLLGVVIPEGEWVIEIRQYSCFNYAGFYLGFS
jgi:hypothetical protein